MNRLATFLLLAVGLGSCQRSDAGPQATTPAARYRGQVVRHDLTYDAHGENPRVRWMVQLAAPLRVRGRDDRDYTQVKVFSLPDTTIFRPGVKFRFAYRLGYGLRTVCRAGFSGGLLPQSGTGVSRRAAAIGGRAATPKPRLLV